MLYQTVKVSFTAPNSWKFVPETVPMTAAGMVILKRDPGNASWAFRGANVKGGGKQFSVKVPSEEVAKIQDKYTSMGTFQYSVEVQDGGTTYTSPDPTIVNLQPPLKP